MAAAFFNKFADQSKAVAVSAGTKPAAKVHECVQQAMKQSGIDLADAKPQLLTQELTADANLLVTMGCGETCPVAPGLRTEDWALEDPNGKTNKEVQSIRDEIKTRVLSLLAEIGALKSCDRTVISVDDKTFLQSFEDCSLGATCWTHSAHVRIGWLILETSDSFESALERLRRGIMRFNSTKNTIGYHETITVAFARLIDSRRIDGEDWNAFSNRNKELFDKNYLSRFYSKEVMASESARNSFVEPDLCELPRASFCG